MIDQGSFRRLLHYCHPGLVEKDIPHRNTLRTDILRHAKISEEKVQEKLKNLPCKISFTFDAWTSDPGDPYLSITGHYINSPPDNADNWELKTEQLAFKELHGRHSGKNIAQILTRTVDRYELRGKVIFSTISPSISQILFSLIGRMDD